MTIKINNSIDVAANGAKPVTFEAADDLGAFELVPLEYSIAWLTCAIASRLDAVMVGWPSADQDRLPGGSPDTRPRGPGAPRGHSEGC